MPGAHAILSPSGASRWMACTPSARLEEKFPESTSTYAEEGTLAHAVAELILLDEPDFRKKLEKLKNSKLGKQYYSDALYGYADEYADYVRGHVTKGAMLFVEQKLDLTPWIPQGFGTGDCIVFRDHKGRAEMHQFDYKHGQGVVVHAEQNKQLMSYALAALEQYGFMYDVDTVVLHIYQPRIDNISTWEISVEDLRTWGENELKPKAALAWEGKGDFAPGEHCRFCKVSGQCKALAEHNLEIARHEFFGEDPESGDLMSVEEVAKVLKQAETIQLWVKLLHDFVFKKALEGAETPGFKVVEGRKSRAYSDEAAIIAELEKAGFDKSELLTKPELLGLTALKKVTKTKAFTEIVEPMLVVNEGKPTLVPDTDKRPAWSSASSDFKDLLNGNEDGSD